MTKPLQVIYGQLTTILKDPNAEPPSVASIGSKGIDRLESKASVASRQSGAQTALASITMRKWASMASKDYKKDKKIAASVDDADWMSVWARIEDKPNRKFAGHFKPSHVAELLGTIEAMRCCGNCKYREHEDDELLYCQKDGEYLFNKLDFKCDKWEQRNAN